MKTPSCFFRIVSVGAAVAFASVAVAQPPPGCYQRHCRSSSDAADSSVARLHGALKKRGYDLGAIDVEAGSGNRTAIRGFREDNGLVSSTRIDGTLLRALGL